jgi:uncharacterized protein YkwD
MSKNNSSESSVSRSNHNDARKSKVVTSMSNFLSDDDDFDYLGSLTAGINNKTSSRSITRNSTRKTTPTSYRKKATNKDRNLENSIRNSEHRRLNIPKSSKPKSTRSKSKDANPPESGKSLMQSARKLIDKAARAASPGRLRARSKSPGPMKSRISSSTSSTTDNLTATPPSPKSPGRLKKKEVSQEISGENAKSTRSRKMRSKSPGKLKNRSESPGRLKKRSESPGSPGGLKKRSESPGALRKTARSRRRPENGDGDDSGRRGARSTSNGPLRKPERIRSHDRHKSKSKRDDNPMKPLRSASSNEEALEGDAPLKQNESDSNMQDELNRYKVKRNKSMDAVTAHQSRKNTQQLDDDKERRPPRRAESMMLSREMGRRSKSNSLSNLIQYKEEEIHSTSYFASNHVLINRERMKRGLRPLTRNIAMDELARKSAEAMATSCGLNALPTTYVGNVLRGESIRSIHRSTMLQKQGRERQNILNPYFQDFGVGTCKGDDGMLYMCQLFSERLELALTDTTKTDEAQED